MSEFHSKIKTIEWVDNFSRMVDQTVLPYEFKYVEIKTGDEMFKAIRTMIVRGAPAIGVAGAHGVVLYAQELAEQNLSRDEFVNKLLEKADYMASSRPTAVNLMWAVDKQKEIIKNSTAPIEGIVEELKQNGIKLEKEDVEINKRIGDYGAEVVPKGSVNSYTLQRRRAGYSGLWNGAWRCKKCICKRQYNPGFCGRNPPKTAGCKDYDT